MGASVSVFCGHDQKKDVQRRFAKVYKVTFQKEEKTIDDADEASEKTKDEQTMVQNNCK